MNTQNYIGIDTKELIEDIKGSICLLKEDGTRDCTIGTWEKIDYYYNIRIKYKTLDIGAHTPTQRHMFIFLEDKISNYILDEFISKSTDQLCGINMKGIDEEELQEICEMYYKLKLRQTPISNMDDRILEIDRLRKSFAGYNQDGTLKK